MLKRLMQPVLQEKTQWLLSLTPVLDLVGITLDFYIRPIAVVIAVKAVLMATAVLSAAAGVAPRANANPSVNAATNIVVISDNLNVFMILPLLGRVEMVNNVAQKDIWLRRTSVRRDQA